MDFKNIIWNEKTYKEFINYLYGLEDKKYKEFNDKTIVTKYKTIGVRVPILRNIAKEISKSDFRKLFEFTRKSDIFEIIFIEGVLYSYIKDFNEVKKLIFDYSKRIDTWALTDMVGSSLKQIKKNKLETLKIIDDLINEKYDFSKRLGYILLLDYFIEIEYLELIFNYIKNEKSDNYYVKMAIAWLLSEMYIKRPKETHSFLKENKLDDFVLRKTISKINDSYRVNKETKEKLKKDFLH